MTKQEEIEQLKRDKDAVILAHYYVEPQIKEIADYVGDSFYLSKIAVELTHSTLVFCGVSFMGESAKLLNSGKTVLMPDDSADCPMAHMVTREEIESYREKYPDLAVVCYINSTAMIKSWSDVSVTSANAVKIVKNLPNHDILFIPDRNLGSYVARQIPEKNIMVADGYCPIHENIRAEELRQLKAAHPHAQILAHPECNRPVLAMADYIGSTSGILKYASDSSGEEYIIATEIGIRWDLEQNNPGKRFYFPTTLPICTDMKKITLDKIINVMKQPRRQLTVPDSLTASAGDTLTRMLELAK